MSYSCNNYAATKSPFFIRHAWQKPNCLRAVDRHDKTRRPTIKTTSGNAAVMVRLRREKVRRAGGRGRGGRGIQQKQQRLQFHNGLCESVPSLLICSWTSLPLSLPSSPLLTPLLQMLQCLAVSWCLILPSRVTLFTGWRKKASGKHWEGDFYKSGLVERHWMLLSLIHLVGL